MSLKAQRERFQDWWQALALRERYMLLAGSGFALLFLLYLLIWSPMMERTAKLRKRVTHLQSSLQWMQRADQRLSASHPGTGGVALQSLQSPTALLGVLKEGLATEGLESSVKQLKQGGANEVVLTLQAVNFDHLTKFLLEFTKRYPVKIKQMVIRALPEPGMVDASLMLELS